MQQWLLMLISKGLILYFNSWQNLIKFSLLHNSGENHFSKHNQNVHLIDCKRLSGAGNLYELPFSQGLLVWRVWGALTHSWTDTSWPGEQPQNAVDTGSVLQQIHGRSHKTGSKSPGALGSPTAGSGALGCYGVKGGSAVPGPFRGCCCPEPAADSSKMLLLKAQPPV